MTNQEGGGDSAYSHQGQAPFLAMQGRGDELVLGSFPVPQAAQGQGLGQNL